MMFNCELAKAGEEVVAAVPDGFICQHNLIATMYGKYYCCLYIVDSYFILTYAFWINVG